MCAFNNGVPINGGAWPNYDRQGAEIMDLPTNAFTELRESWAEFWSPVTEVLAAVNSTVLSAGAGHPLLDNAAPGEE